MTGPGAAAPLCISLLFLPVTLLAQVLRGKSAPDQLCTVAGGSSGCLRHEWGEPPMFLERQGESREYAADLESERRRRHEREAARSEALTDVWHPPREPEELEKPSSERPRSSLASFFEDDSLRFRPLLTRAIGPQFGPDHPAVFFRAIGTTRRRPRYKNCEVLGEDFGPITEFGVGLYKCITKCRFSCTEVLDGGKEVVTEFERDFERISGSRTCERCADHKPDES